METPQKAIEKVRDLEIHEINPFLQNVDYGQKRRTEVLFNGEHALVNKTTGEVTDDLISVARYKVVDSQQFVKVYLDNLHVFFDLGKPAQRVCEFVLHQIGHRSIGKDEVIIIYNEYEKYLEGRTGGTRQTFMRGMQELASKRLLAKSPSPNIWWLNPAIAFNGDRARFITEYRKESKENKLSDNKENLIDFNNRQQENMTK